MLVMMTEQRCRFDVGAGIVPYTAQIIKDRQHRADNPTHRIRPADGTEAEQTGAGIREKNTNEQIREGGRHKRLHCAAAAKDAVTAVFDADEEIKRADGMQELGADGDYL